MLIDEHYVVEIIDGFKAQQERGIPVLLKYHCRSNCGLHAMNSATADYTTKALKSGVVSFLVVGKRVEITLNLLGGS